MQLVFSQLMAAPVIEGVRMPDDVSDVIIHRNGKFFTNSFIPGDSTVSIKLEEPAKMSVQFYNAILINFSRPDFVISLSRGKAAVKLRRRSRSSFSDDSTLKAAVRINSFEKDTCVGGHGFRLTRIFRAFRPF